MTRDKLYVACRRLTGLHGRANAGGQSLAHCFLAAAWPGRTLSRNISQCLCARARDATHYAPGVWRIYGVAHELREQARRKHAGRPL